jgi:hypothetical protein
MPVNEVRLVSKAFDSLNTASQTLLDELAIAERVSGKGAALARAKDHAKSPPTDKPGERCPHVLLIGTGVSTDPSVQNGFCAEDSYYYSELSDPPATRAFRQALAATGDYTKLLIILAEGRNIDEAMEQLTSLTSNLGGALSGALSMVGAPGIKTALTPLVAAFNPLLKTAATNANATELKRLVSVESPKVLVLVKSLRDQSKEFFNTLTEANMARFNLAYDKPELAAIEMARIEAYRISMSNYVVLLEQYGDLLDDLAKTYSESRNRASLAALNERSAQLSAQVDAWRRTSAALRTALK